MLVELCFDVLVCGENQFILVIDFVLVFVCQVDDVVLLVEFELDGFLVIVFNLEVELNIMNFICGQNDGVVSVVQVLNGSGNYIYLWNNQLIEFGLIGLLFGDSYNFSLMDEVSGCMVMVNLDVFVNEGVSVFINFFEVICVGEEYLFNGEVLIISGVYFDILIIVNVQCDSVVILDLSVLFIFNVEIVGDIIFCFGDGLQIFFVVEVVGYQYLWFIGEQENFILVDGLLVLVVIIVIVINGCIVIDLVMIFLDEFLVVMIMGFLISCGGILMEVMVSGGEFYVWFLGVMIFIVVLFMGQYVVEVISLVGCIVIIIVEVIVEEVLLLLNYVLELIGCGNGLDILEIMVEGDLIVDWFVVDISLLLEGVMIFIFFVSGEYLVQVRDLIIICVLI